ncbi:hypothetical protein IPJ72_01220 [Candidatus Peregrinibacteria bacterium]|nr:MAG: hypothetical protein IPJ72_01220 [Candidatus Peregrinibacteria bacterium]
MNSKLIEEFINEFKADFPEVELETSELKKLIEKMISEKPEIPLDETFKNILKQQLMKQAQDQSPASTPAWIKWIASFGGGIVTAAFIGLLVWPSQMPVNENTPPSTANKMSVAMGVETPLITIEENDTENAFGTISKDEVAGNGEAAVSEPSVGIGKGGGGGADSRYIMPYPGGRINFTYTYSGDPITADATTTRVYQGKQNSLLSSNILSQLSAQGIDLSSFKNLSVQNIAIKESVGDWPYIVNIDNQGQSINIYQNYEVWQQSRCRLKDQCQYSDPKPVTKEEFSNEAAFINVAKEFLNQHGIQVKDTGAPYVEKYWLENQEVTEPTYYPENATIVFPLMIANKEVMQQWGGKMGIRVDVGVRDRLVNSAYIPVLALESSDYNAYTSEELLSLAAAGGNEGITYTNPERVVNLELGSPKREIRNIGYQTKDFVYRNLFVEMLVFPIKDTPDKKQYLPWQKEIVVPLAKNLYQ